jgi:single-strand DNA-binding protein
MYETYVTVQGRLVADPVVKTTQDGLSFAVFRVAQSERRPVRGEPGRWADGEPSYYDVTAFRGIGTNAGRSLRKGQPVIVHGRQRIRLFERGDGSTGAKAEIDALAIGHDLRWGTSEFTRNGDVPAAVDPLARPEVREALDAQALAAPGGGLGNPETDPYVVAGEPAGAGEGPESPAADSGPLVRPDGERAA